MQKHIIAYLFCLYLYKKYFDGLIMNRKIMIIILLVLVFSNIVVSAQEVVVGAARIDQYVPLLKGKKIGLFSNHTGVVNGRHTLDIMLENGLDVVTIFSPEHGFRGTADAGESVNSSVDTKTGICIESLYGSNKKKALSKTKHLI